MKEKELLVLYLYRMFIKSYLSEGAYALIVITWNFDNVI